MMKITNQKIIAKYQFAREILKENFNTENLSGLSAQEIKDCLQSKLNEDDRVVHK